MSYESWRISYQSSEQAARAAYAEAEALRKEVAALRETLRDVTGVAICALFDSHREDTLREFSLQELARVIYVTAPLMKDGVTVESVYRRGYDAALEAEDVIDGAD